MGFDGKNLCGEIWRGFRQINSGVVNPEEVGFISGMRNRSVVLIDPEIMSGEPCFAGTRVPVRALLDYLEGGDTIDEFLEQYPTVTRQQAIAFLEEASASLLAVA